MKPPDPKARSREALQGAVDRYGRDEAKSAAHGPEPWPGDLYVLAETAGWPVEWLVVERTPGHCRLVAADADPASGSADVPVPAEAEGGPLTVRCAVHLQVGVGVLHRGERTGTVPPEILDRVRRRLEELAAGAIDLRLDEPDFELQEMLARARAALLPVPVEATQPAFRRLSAGAALFVLVVALGGVSVLAWRSQQREHQALLKVARLTAERRDLEADHRRQLAALRPSPPPPRPSALPPPPSESLANLAYATFYPEVTRGALQEIAVPEGATHLFLLFYVGQNACPTYRLEIAHPGAPAALFTVRELKPLASQEVNVVVPRKRLPDGSYQFRLSGQCPGGRGKAVTYEARVKKGPP